MAEQTPEELAQEQEDVRQYAAELVMVARKSPTLREQIAVVLDMTAALGTPEVVYRRKTGEDIRDTATRLRAEVLAQADLVCALLAEHDHEVLTQHEARRKAAPVIIQNIAGENASVWIGKIRQEAIAGTADWLESFLDGDFQRESGYVLARAAEVLGAHQRWASHTCLCGASVGRTGQTADVRDALFAAHQTQMLVDAGLLAVAAPVAGGNGAVSGWGTSPRVSGRDPR